MNTAAAPHSAIPASAPAAARSALRMLQRLRRGTLSVQLPDGSMQRFGNGEAPRATIRLHNWKVCKAALRSSCLPACSAAPA